MGAPYTLKGRVIRPVKPIRCGKHGEATVEAHVPCGIGTITVCIHCGEAVAGRG